MRYYFDHASTSPCRPQALEAMRSVWELCGDPSRVHQEALEVRQLLEIARKQVASFFGTSPRSVVFTSGATESASSAIASASQRGTHQISNMVEHSTVNLSLAALAESNPDLRHTLVPSDPQGLVDPQAMLDAVCDDTSLVHLQLANHETGAVQPVKELADGCRDRKVWLHSNAAQASGHMRFGFDDLGVDFMSVSSHKMGGPVGVGALLVRRGLRLDPLFKGGDQERARRAGLENLPGIVGFGAACVALQDNLSLEISQQQKFTSQISQQLITLEGIELLGPKFSEKASHISCFYLTDIEPQALVLELDRQGFAVHSGSACSSETSEPSPVLTAMGLEGSNSLRVSVGWNTTQVDVDTLLQAMPEAIAKIRSLKPS